MQQNEVIQYRAINSTFSQPITRPEDCVSGQSVHHRHNTGTISTRQHFNVQSFILNFRLGFLANPFLHRPFPFLPD